MGHSIKQSETAPADNGVLAVLPCLKMNIRFKDMLRQVAALPGVEGAGLVL